MIKKLLSGFIAVVLSFSLFGCESNKNEVDLMQNVSLKSIGGFSGSGILRINHNETDDWALIDRNDQNNYAFFQSIKYELKGDKNQDHKYSNGDEVTVVANYNENYAKQAGITVTNSEKKFKIDFLPEVFTKAKQIKKFSKELEQGNKKVLDYILNEDMHHYGRNITVDNTLIGSYLVSSVQSQVAVYVDLYLIHRHSDEANLIKGFDTVSDLYSLCAIGPWETTDETFEYNDGYMPNNYSDTYLDGSEYTEDDINKVLLFRMNERTSYDVDAENKDEYTIVKIK